MSGPEVAEPQAARRKAGAGPRLGDQRWLGRLPEAGLDLETAVSIGSKPGLNGLYPEAHLCDVLDGIAGHTIDRTDDPLG